VTVRSCFLPSVALTVAASGHDGAYLVLRVTEIPEHLLKRSRDRRAALGLGGGEAPPSAEGAGEAAPAATPATPAATPAAAPPAGPAGRRPVPAPAETPPPKPDPPYVAAAKARRKIPFWAMAALSLMPIWAFMYVRALTRPPETVEGPMAIGAEVYGNCSSCHGATGGGTEAGGSGRPLWNGEVNETFPHIEDQVRFVYFGTEAYNSAGVSSYGNPDREGGAHTAGSLGPMPPWGANAGGDLTDAEILAVVCHERYDFGVDPEADEATAAEFELWCSPESPMFAALEAGTPLADLDTSGIAGPDGAPVEIIDIGDAPAEGSAP
jgi:mono/diheme cytochrome c family protein